MKKKVKSATNQTRELSRAKWEFFKRNPENMKWLAEHKDIRESRKWYEERIKNYIGEMPNFDEILEECMQCPAVIEDYRFFEFIHECPDYFFSEKISDDEVNEKWLFMLKKKADLIFKLLTLNGAANTLLLGIDLTRSKEAIMAEVESLVIKYREFYYDNNLPNQRLKWLPKADKLLEVWDLYDKAGQKPATRTFKIISKIVGRPVSTIKSQWYMAYEKIYGQKFDPEKTYSTEEKKDKAMELCANCPHLAPRGKGAKCHSKGDWFPCADYLKIAGKEKPKPIHLEFKDEIYK